MSLLFNNKNINKVTFGGKEVKKIVFNGKTVWEDNEKYLIKIDTGSGLISSSDIPEEGKYYENGSTITLPLDIKIVNGNVKREISLVEGTFDFYEYPDDMHYDDWCGPGNYEGITYKCSQTLFATIVYANGEYINEYRNDTDTTIQTTIDIILADSDCTITAEQCWDDYITWYETRYICNYTFDTYNVSVETPLVGSVGSFNSYDLTACLNSNGPFCKGDNITVYIDGWIKFGYVPAAIGEYYNITITCYVNGVKEGSKTYYRDNYLEDQWYSVGPVGIASFTMPEEDVEITFSITN